MEDLISEDSSPITSGGGQVGQTTEGNKKPDVTVNSEVSGEAGPLPAPKMTPPSKTLRCHRKRKILWPRQSTVPTLMELDPMTYRPRSQGQRVRSWGRLWWDGEDLLASLSERVGARYTGNTHRSWAGAKTGLRPPNLLDCLRGGRPGLCLSLGSSGRLWLCSVF